MGGCGMSVWSQVAKLCYVLCVAYSLSETLKSLASLSAKPYCSAFNS